MPTEKRQRQKEGQRARREQALAELRRRQRRRRLQITGIFAVVVVALLVISTVVGGGEGGASGEDAADRRKPKISAPKGAAPKKLVVEDLIEGAGAEAKKGDEVQVNYVGVTYADLDEFDSSYDGDPATFTLSEGSLIEGWVEGIPGMKEGGRRKLVIPGSLAYGDEDTGDGRPHGALIFVIDLIKVS